MSTQETPSSSRPASKSLEMRGLVVGLGDSTCAGVGGREGSFVDYVWRRVVGASPKSRLSNLCRSGATVDEVVRYQLPRLQGSVDLALLSVGANDVTSGTSDALFKRSFGALVAGVASHARVVVVSNIPDASLAPAVPPAFRTAVHERIAAFNELISQVAKEKRVLVFDTFAMSRAILPQHPEFFARDGYHPSDAGYRLWADELWPLVAKALELAS